MSDDPVWVLLTWRHVRADDDVRPPGGDIEARVLYAGPVLMWRVGDRHPRDDWEARDMQFNPQRYAGQWSERCVVLAPGGRRRMLADAAVEVRFTAGEAAAIGAVMRAFPGADRLGTSDRSNLPRAAPSA